jgi:hypothetical protein
LPTIDAVFLQSVVYLYPDADAAKRGVGAGGTGFLVGVSSGLNADPAFARTPKAMREIQASGSWALYAVTAAHVVVLGCPVVRISTRDGKTRVLDLPLNAWQLHPDGDDVAVCSIGPATEHGRIAFVPEPFLLSEEDFADQGFTPGSEVFFVGRFMGYDGQQRNAPSVRFGNLAIAERVPVRNEKSGISQESILVEMRSLPGYSGSPVFLYNPVEQFLLKDDELHYSPNGLENVWLLGVDWCHLTSKEPVRQKDGSPLAEDLFVNQNSGMAGVVPAWKVAQLLHEKEPTHPGSAGAPKPDAARAR